MESILNEEKLERSIEKIQMYNTQEKIGINSIKTSLNNISSFYNTDNKEQLDSLIFEIDKKLNIISKNHDSDKLILVKNLDTYRTMKVEVANDFDEII